ncbi:MAG: hypothetical protein JEY79_05495 [Pseudodesulfovibrio sp.]|nr:hypothetical protein [Pseudodesulfovibrio sp.]
MSDKKGTPSIWFKTARQVHQYVTCPIGDSFLWGDGESATKDSGAAYEVAEKTVYNHVDDKEGKEKLKRNRARKFAKRTVDIYAKLHLSKVVGSADPAEEDEAPITDSQTSAANRVDADTKVKVVTAKLKELELKRQLGQTMPTAAVERELGERSQAFKLHMSSFMRDFAPELLSHIGGDLQAAKEMIELVNGDPEKAEQLSGFVFSRRPLLLDGYKKWLVDALNVFAKGEWFTDEMRDAWDKLVVAQKEEEATVIASLFQVAGVDPSLFGVVMERFEIRIREDGNV